MAISIATGRAALTFTDDGRHIDPQAPDEWDDWVSAGRLRNFCEDDPLLDWLQRYGRQHGYVPDDELDGYDSRTDMRGFVMQRGQLFEESVVRLIRERLDTVRIGHGPGDTRDLGRAQETFDAMRAAVPVVEQAVLRNPEDRTYGAVDLLVRADLLNELIPDSLDPGAAATRAPALGSGSWHYVAVDIKFHAMALLKDGGASGDGTLPYMAQVWIYNEALGRLQGYRPAAAFLLGRCWTQGKERGEACFERLARVDHDRVLNPKTGRRLEDVVRDGLDWVRRVRRAGADWRVLPEPTVPELYPHAKNDMDAPWHAAKRYIAEQLAELTLLPATSPAKRRAAHERGLKRWDDVRVDAAALGITSPSDAIRCDAVLLANRTPGDEVVFPDRIRHPDSAWRTPAPLEVYVDFETVSNLADDFTLLPRMGGQPLIFQIGCGWYEDGEWRFRQWTVDRIREPNEAVIVGQWVDHMAGLLLVRGLGWPDLRVIHWSPAEWVSLATAYNSAVARHPEQQWPALPWFDLLREVVKAEPISVRGAFNYSLKSVAKAMHAHGLIETVWGDGPTDGLGAMVGAWWCDAEAARLDSSMQELELMAEIGRYNEVDCRTMAEILVWLRANR